MKIAFLFAGQGAQYAGMGKEIFDEYDEAKEVFKIASKSLNMDMEKLCFEGPDQELMKTENTQPSILTVDVAIMKVLESKGIKPDMVAGLSLGEYAALVEANVLDFAEAVALVKKRGKYMQEEVPIGKGTMAAIIGLEREKVEKIALEASSIGICEPANFNYPGQIVISGEIDAVNKACELAATEGGKGIVLPVSAPFHCSMLNGASVKLDEELKTITVKKADKPVIANVTAEYYKEDNIKELLVKQVASAVMWEDSILKMIDDGIDTFIEIGPGKSLTGFVKKIARKNKLSVACHNVENIKSLNAVLEI